MATALELYREAFSGHRDLRSRAYMDGVYDALRYWLGERQHLVLPYVAGTAEADAWFAGSDEGARIARQYNAVRKEAYCIDANGLYQAIGE